MKQKIKDTLKALGRGLAEFFAPRDWIPSIPLPPRVPKNPRPEAGYQSLWEAIEGFPKDEKR